MREETNNLINKHTFFKKNHHTESELIVCT